MRNQGLGFVPCAAVGKAWGEAFQMIFRLD